MSTIERVPKGYVVTGYSRPRIRMRCMMARVLDKTGEELACEFTVETADGRDEITLRTVTFHSTIGKFFNGGVEVVGGQDLARFLSILHEGEEHLNWEEIEKEVLLQHCLGETWHFEREDRTGRSDT